jgi:hypothetical protein
MKMFAKIDAKIFAKPKILAETFSKMISFGKHNFDQASSQLFGGKFRENENVRENFHENENIS